MVATSPRPQTGGYISTMRVLVVEDEPDLRQAIVRAERLDRSDVLYIGDELRDVEAAKKAGVKVAAVTWGFHNAELLRTGTPDYVVNDANELVGLVGLSSSRSPVQ